MMQAESHNDRADFFIEEVILTTTDYDAALSFWCEQLGYNMLYQQNLTDPALLDLWQVSPHQVNRRALLGLPNAHTAIHLVELLTSATPLKEGVNNLDALPKTLNLLVKDLPVLWEKLKAAGVAMKTEWVEYEQEGRFYRDAHIIGPDLTGIGLLEVLDEDYAVNTFGIGEPASFTSTVENIVRESEFYQQLGGQIVLDEYFSGQAIETLVGLPQGGSLRMQLLGPALSHSRVELVSYGIPMTSHYHRVNFKSTGAILPLIATSAAHLPDTIHFVPVSIWNTTKQMARLVSPAGATIMLCRH